VSLIPQAEHTAHSYPFEILANLTLHAAARACGARGGVGAGVQAQACSAWGARATQAVAWRRKVTWVCSGRGVRLHACARRGARGQTAPCGCAARPA
jgi:hypothetical protein